MIDLTGKRVIISRTDSIGDVMLTLPICAWLKSQFDGIHIIFLGKGYTRSVVEAYQQVDQFVDWASIEKLEQANRIDSLKDLNADAIIHVFPNKTIAKLAKKASIPVRVGTSHRAHHLLTCTHRPNFTRKRSDLHESQLNHELLRPFGLEQVPSLEDIIATTKSFQPVKVELPEPFNQLENFVILHPKSQGSAKEWPIDKYIDLAKDLVEEGKKVVFTGTENEGDLFRADIPESEYIFDSTGKLTLEQLMHFIGEADALVACSTGPLHIAGYSGIKAVGLFSPKRPIHPGRWKALGPNVKILVKDEACQPCQQGKDCYCIEDISVDAVKATVLN